MSKGLTYSESIKVSSNFGFTGAKPLDARSTVQTLNDLNAMPVSQTYESMIVYVVALKKFYVRKNNAWEPFTIKSNASSPIQVSGSLWDLTFSLSATGFKLPVGVTDSEGNIIATQSWVTSQFAAADAMTYKGVIAPGSTLPAGNAGDTYKCSGTGKISNIDVHTGDLFICKIDNTGNNVPANWDLVCVGDTSGSIIIDNPGATHNVGDIIVFSTTSGTIVKNSNINISDIGKVACASGETKRFLSEQLVSKTTLVDNEYAVSINHVNQKLELSVKIQVIDGGYYD